MEKAAQAPKPAVQEWDVRMTADIIIRQGQTLRFVPHIGARVGEPNPFQAVANKYYDQDCVVVDVEKDDFVTRILVRFADGYERSIVANYFCAQKPLPTPKAVAKQPPAPKLSRWLRFLNRLRNLRATMA